MPQGERSVLMQAEAALERLNKDERAWLEYYTYYLPYGEKNGGLNRDERHNLKALIIKLIGRGGNNQIDGRA